MKSILSFAVALIAIGAASAGDCAGGASVLRVRSAGVCQQATAYEYEAPAVATVQTVVVPTVVSQLAYQPVVQVQRVVQVQQVQQVQHVQQVVQVQKVQQVRKVRARGNANTLDVQPSGLAGLLGLQGPRIRSSSDGDLDVKPSGIAGILGFGGPRISSRSR